MDDVAVQRQQEIRDKLFKASMEGDTDVLSQIIQKYPQYLASVYHYGETPLHMAVMLGHIDFTRAILQHDSRMAANRTEVGQTALHLAAARGHVDIVKMLLDASIAVLKDVDAEGRTALHLAVMRGNVKVVEELIRAGPELDSYTSQSGRTILHVAALYNRLLVLKTLLLLGRYDAEQTLNAKDKTGYGNTVLHTAVYLKQVEMVRYLLSNALVKVNAVNDYHQTALDISLHVVNDERSMGIQKLLWNAGDRRHEDLPNSGCRARMSSIVAPVSSIVSSVPTVSQPLLEAQDEEKRVKENGKDRLEAGVLVLAAAIFVAIAFQNVSNLPVGFWNYEGAAAQNNLNFTGTAVTYLDTQLFFWLFNSFGMLASLHTIVVYARGVTLTGRSVIWILRTNTLLALLAITFTYTISGSKPLRYILATVAAVCLFAASRGVIDLVGHQ